MKIKIQSMGNQKDINILKIRRLVGHASLLKKKIASRFTRVHLTVHPGLLIRRHRR